MNSIDSMGGRPHMGQIGSADPPGKMDEKLKSENMQNKSSFYVYVWHQLGDMQACTSLQHPTTQFFTGRMPFLPPNQQRQSTEGCPGPIFGFGKSNTAIDRMSATDRHSCRVH